MNYLYAGYPTDLNIGNGKTVSAIRHAVNEYISGKKIFSNIVLSEIEYTLITPKTLFDVLRIGNAVVILDEIHAVVHKNHRITERCGKHETKGLCYLLTEFLRQVRKRDIECVVTAQTFSDCHFQIRQVIQEVIVCEKYSIEGGYLRKCEKNRCKHDKHMIKQVNQRTQDESYFSPEPFYQFYDTAEIVEGWVSTE